MHVLAVLMQTPLIFHFSRPQPFFKLLYALAHFSCIAIFYFSNCVSHIENINVAWPFLVKALMRLPLFHLWHLCGSPKLRMVLPFSVSHGVQGHLLAFTLGLFGYLKPSGPCSKGIACSLKEPIST